jgi:hypothetical protein
MRTADDRDRYEALKLLEYEALELLEYEALRHLLMRAADDLWTGPHANI